MIYSSANQRLTLALSIFALVAFFSQGYSWAQEETEYEAPVPDMDFRLRSYLDIIYGDNLSEVEANLGESFKQDGEEVNNCKYGTFDQYPGVYFLVIDGVISSGHIGETYVKTLGGITIGDSPDRISSYFPDAVKEDHAYKETYPDGYYLTQTAHENFGIRFEVYNGKIQTISAGLLDAITLVEGCL